jgi:hypothetical protein
VKWIKPTLEAFLLPAFFVCITLVHTTAQQKSASTSISACPHPRTLDAEQNFEHFAIRIYHGKDQFDSCVEVANNGAVVFSKHENGQLAIGNGVQAEGTEQSRQPTIALGTDITGNGKPNVILTQWSGGAHCCLTFHVLELGKSVREIASVEAMDSDYAHFEDINHDGIFEFVGWDFTFRYWHTSFADSPAPRIILKWNGEVYEPALNLMREPAPSAENLGQIAEQVRTGDWLDDYPPPLLWKTMLQLIYTGHPDIAWKLTGESWKSGPLSQQVFLRDFCGQLATSLYFGSLQPTLTDAPCKFDPSYEQKW